MGNDLAAQGPLPPRVAVGAIAGSVAEVGRLATHHRLRQPRTRRGVRVRFADGTTARIYRETAVRDRVATEPCALVVRFRLRGVHGVGHAVFRAASLLNTPLFAGFPGFVSTWWLGADEHGVYRGLYEWDGAARADAYARALWPVLAVVSVPGSVAYRVLDGRHRDDLLAELPRDTGGAWWQPVAAV